MKLILTSQLQSSWRSVWILLALFTAVHFSNITVKASGPDRVFIINEGAFGQSNASITVFYPSSGQTKPDIFSSTNGRLLGDVANDAQWINGKLYVVVNNSHKIEVIDPQTYQSLQTIFIDSDAHGGSPRRIMQVSDDKAYVTNLFGNNVSVIDLATGQEAATVDVGGGPEGIVTSNGFAFVALSGLGQGNEVAVIDIETDEVATRLEVGDNPIHMAVAPDGMVWSVATGNYGFNENFQYDPELETFGEAVIIDPQTLQIADRFETGGHPGKLVFRNGEEAFLHLDGLRRIDVKNRRLLEEPFLQRPFFSFEIAEMDHPDYFHVYLTIVPDFLSSGRVVRYDEAAVAIDSFRAGIGPASIAFWQEASTNATIPAEHLQYFELGQNYPNPFNAKTVIPFNLKHEGMVQIEIVDLQGRVVATPLAAFRSAGNHVLVLDTDGWASGIYLYRLLFEGSVRYEKMSLVK